MKTEKQKQRAKEKNYMGIIVIIMYSLIFALFGYSLQPTINFPNRLLMVMISILLFYVMIQDIKLVN